SGFRGNASSTDPARSFAMTDRTLLTARDAVASVMPAVTQLAVETPSWGYGNSGTRFKVFPQSGVPRNPFEKVEDAATVGRFTGGRAVAAGVQVLRTGLLSHRRPGLGSGTERVQTGRATGSGVCRYRSPRDGRQHRANRRHPASRGTPGRI